MSYVLTARNSDEERNKRFVMTITFSILIPSLILFTILDYPREGLLVACMDAGLASLLVVNLFLMRSVKLQYLAYRMTIIAMFIVMSWVLTNGNAEGRSFVWYYFFPIGVFYLFGLKEGFFWVGLSVLIATSCFFFSPYYDYDPVFSIRYLVTYFIVIGLSAGMEGARSRYHAKLQREKASLEAALEQVHRLHGLLPICASCKKIRDDKGYWNELEQYISTNSDVQFSHGLCPDCKDIYMAELEDHPGRS